MILGLHIAAGSTALLSLAIPFLSEWGGRRHKQAGWVFTVAMGVVCLSAWVLAALRLTDVSVSSETRASAWFLAHVGLLSAASVWMGIRAARLKRAHRKRRTWSDLAWPLALSMSSLGLTIAGIGQGNVLFVVFACLGLATAVPQLRYWLRDAQDGREWLVQHLGAMGAGGIAAVTAFFVVNVPRLGLEHYALLFWIGPGVLGGILLSRLSAHVRNNRPRVSQR